MTRMKYENIQEIAEITTYVQITQQILKRILMEFFKTNARGEFPPPRKALKKPLKKNFLYYMKNSK